MPKLPDTAPAEHLTTCALEDCTNAVDLDYDDHELLSTGEIVCLDAHWHPAAVATVETAALAAELLADLRDARATDPDLHRHEVGDAVDDAQAFC